VIDSWNARYECSDLVEFAKWMDYSKKCISVSSYDDNDFVLRDADGKCQRVNVQRAEAEIAALMGDKSLKGTRMTFVFDILTTPSWTSCDVANACEAFDVKTPGGVRLFKSASGYGGRTFVYEPESQSCAGGGIHLSLDCCSFVAQWHTVAHMTASFPMTRDARASFRVTMIW
jgi:hypothetical protein